MPRPPTPAFETTMPVTKEEIANGAKTLVNPEPLLPKPGTPSKPCSNRGLLTGAVGRVRTGSVVGAVVGAPGSVPRLTFGRYGGISKPAGGDSTLPAKSLLRTRNAAGRLLGL